MGFVRRFLKRKYLLRSVPYSIGVAVATLIVLIFVPEGVTYYWVIEDLFVASVLCIFIFSVLMVAVYGIKGLIYFVWKIRPREKQGVVNASFLAMFVLFAFFTSQRVSNLEARFGGRVKLQCSEEEVSKRVSENVVRIIGSYGEGSGFPITESLILTNFHVIEGEVSPKVVFGDGSIEAPVKIMGSREKDIAVLELARKLTPLPFYGYMGAANESSNMSVGEPIYAVGYPLGSQIEGEPTVLKGSYSGVRRMEYLDMDVISSSISLVEGMSGGPLVDSCGQVLGINTMGVGGLSMFLEMGSVQAGIGDTTNKEVEKLVIDTGTPLGVVEAFYAYIKSRNLEMAYGLVHSDRIEGDNLEHWSEGYNNTLQVDLVMTKIDEDENKIWVKLVSQDWVDGGLVTNYYEGYWILEDLKLNKSDIKMVDEPEWEWFYGWEEVEE